jgi:hypothetical protein
MWRAPIVCRSTIYAQIAEIILLLLAIMGRSSRDDGQGACRALSIMDAKRLSFDPLYNRSTLWSLFDPEESLSPKDLSSSCSGPAELRNGESATE